MSEQFARFVDNLTKECDDIFNKALVNWRFRRLTKIRWFGGALILDKRSVTNQKILEDLKKSLKENHIEFIQTEIHY